jgi:hypothetical protein
MNITEAFFMIQFFIVVAIIFIKLFNMFSGFKLYDLKASILLMIGFTLFWGLGLVTALVGHTETLIITIWQLEAWLFGLNILFLFVELLGYLAINSSVKAYQPQK